MLLLFSKKCLQWNLFKKELLIVFHKPLHFLTRAMATVLGTTGQATVLNAPRPFTSLPVIIIANTIQSSRAKLFLKVPGLQELATSFLSMTMAVSLTPPSAPQVFVSHSVLPTWCFTFQYTTRKSIICLFPKAIIISL